MMIFSSNTALRQCFLSLQYEYILVFVVEFDYCTIFLLL